MDGWRVGATGRTTVGQKPSCSLLSFEATNAASSSSSSRVRYGTLPDPPEPSGTLRAPLPQPQSRWKMKGPAAWRVGMHSSLLMFTCLPTPIVTQCTISAMSSPVIATRSVAPS